MSTLPNWDSELISDIFRHHIAKYLPQQLGYNAARLACKRWHTLAPARSLVISAITSNDFPVLKKLFSEAEALFIDHPTSELVRQLFECGFFDATCSVQTFSFSPSSQEVTDLLFHYMKTSHLQLKRFLMPHFAVGATQFFDTFSGSKDSLVDLNCSLELNTDACATAMSQFFSSSGSRLKTLTTSLRVALPGEYGAAIFASNTITDLNLDNTGTMSSIQAREFCKHFSTNYGALRRLKIDMRSFEPDVKSLFARTLIFAPSLTSLELPSVFDHQGGPYFCSSLPQMTGLKKLRLSYCRLNNESGAELGLLVERAKRLVELDLSFTLLPDVAALAIAQNLRYSSVLQCLVLSKCGLAANAAKAIGKSLEYNSSLRFLDMAFNQIGDGGTIAIAKGLKLNKTLQAIYLQRIGATESGMSTFADTIQANSTLKSIYFFESFDKVKHIVPLLKSLATAQGLTSLSFPNCGMDVDTAVLIGKILQTNRSLTELRISSGKIGDGAIAIADALKTHNTTLTVLDASRLEIKCEGLMAFARMLKTNRSLKSLSLSFNPANLECMHAIATAALENDHLQAMGLPSLIQGLTLTQELQELTRNVKQFKGLPFLYRPHTDQ